jgi:tetratricopeptide (TPR) repeat protein
MTMRNILCPALILAIVSCAANATVVIHDLPLPDPAVRAQLDLNSEPGSVVVEPSIQPTEAEIVKSIVEQVQTDPRGALQKLKVADTPQASAMFDFILGNLNFQLDERSEALRYYENAVRKFPNFAKAYKNLGFLALQAEKMDEALKAFVKTVQLGSSEGAVYGLIGYIYLNKENFLSAESAYRDAMLKMPENVDWKLGLGRSVLAHQKHADVMNIMGELITGDPKKRDYWLVQANAFLSMDRVMDSAYNYEMMGRIGIGNKETYQALGNIYVSLEKTPLALIAYLKALDLPEPPLFDTIIASAEIMGARGALVESDVLAARIEEIYGKSTEKEATMRLLKLRSQLAIAQNKQDQAEVLLEKLIALDDTDGQTILLLADFYGRSERYERAKPLYEKAEKLEGFEIDALVKHGQMLVNHGDYEAAIAALERAVERLSETEDFTRRDNVNRYLDSVRRVFRSTRT